MIAALEYAAIRQHAKLLKLPTLGGQFERLAEQAAKESQTHTRYLEVLLDAEVEERERNAIARRMQEARFPKVKTLEDFDFSEAPHVSAQRIRSLAEGGYLARSEPVIFLGEGDPETFCTSLLHH